MPVIDTREPLPGQRRAVRCSSFAVFGVRRERWFRWRAACEKKWHATVSVGIRCSFPSWGWPSALRGCPRLT